MGRRGGIAAFLSISLLLAGCAGVTRERGEAPLSSKSGDPIPRFEDVQQVSADGTKVEGDGIRVTIPADAIQGEATVAVADALGTGAPEMSAEVWGQPVQVDHALPLTKPVTVEWDIAELTEEQRATIALARWNPEFEVWELTDVSATVHGDTLTAELTEFSAWTWISGRWNSINQTIGEWTGKRVARPKCSGESLPDWVNHYVRPDEDITGTPVLTCVEPDKEDVFTLRIANNRSHGQRVTLTPEGQKWGWVWKGDEDFSVTGSVWSVVGLTDSQHTVMVPPTSEIAVGIERPAQPGVVQVRVSAQSDALSIFGDLLSGAMGNISPGGYDNPVANAFMQGMYACGGGQLASRRPGSAREGMSMAIDAFRSCAEAATGQGEFADVVMGGVEDALRAEVAKGGQSASRAIKGNRLIHQVSSRLYILQIADVSEYLSNQLADSILGPTTFTANLRGRPAEIGAWIPTCTDPVVDEDVMSRNLVNREPFTDNNLELHEYAEWGDLACKAIAPLAACSVAHRNAVADVVLQKWESSDTAQNLAQLIRSGAGMEVELTATSVGGVEMSGDVDSLRRQLVILFGREPDSDVVEYDYCWEMIGGESGHERRSLEWGGFAILATEDERGVLRPNGWSLTEHDWPAEFTLDPGLYFGVNIHEVERLTGGSYIETFNSVYLGDGLSWYANYETDEVQQISTMTPCD